ncbi:Maf family protein [Mycobacterium sp.]|uniref:Maf family protein n=1 Tax=Mycobacterium sp. TaxID=1785 RepID=UPI003BB007BF
MTRVVLGSASAGRLRVLRQAGVEPLVVVSGVDEDAIIATLGPDTAPGDVVRSLAEAKADHVATIVDGAVAADCVVIGCDSMLYIDGRLTGKPASTDAARREWQSMAGCSGQLHTGHCVVRLRDGRVSRRAAESSVTTVHFGTPAAADLDAYLDSGEPLAVAGAFTLDGLGGWFVDRIEGDPSNVIGLSLPLTRSLLRRVGLSVAELWP